jgi:hypothetical protein
MRMRMPEGGWSVGRDEVNLAGEAECEAVDADRADRRSARGCVRQS